MLPVHLWRGTAPAEEEQSVASNQQAGPQNPLFALMNSVYEAVASFFRSLGECLMAPINFLCGRISAQDAEEEISSESLVVDPLTGTSAPTRAEENERPGPVTTAVVGTLETSIALGQDIAAHPLVSWVLVPTVTELWSTVKLKAYPGQAYPGQMSDF